MWEDCLRAYHQLLELQPKFLDVDILEMLGHAVTRGFPDKDIQAGGCGAIVIYPARQLKDDIICSLTTAGEPGAIAWEDHSTRKSASSRVEVLC